MALVATAGLWLSPARDPYNVLPLAPPIEDGLVRAMASGIMRFSCSSNMSLYSAKSNVIIGAGSVPDVLTIDPSGLIVNGDVQIRGTIEAYLSTEINIQDKVIRLAYPSNVSGVGDAYIDGSGIVLANNATSNYEKSIKWHQSRVNPVGWDAQLSPGGASNEPFWELLGGGLRLTSVRRTDGTHVSFGLHINEKDELEVYKRWTTPGGDERFQRITAFGGGGGNPDFLPPYPL